MLFQMLQGKERVRRMKRVGLIMNKDKPEAIRKARTAEAFFSGNGIQAVYLQEPGNPGEIRERYRIPFSPSSPSSFLFHSSSSDTL